MNVFLKLGSWIERHFPEKITAEEAAKLYTSLKSLIESHGLLLQQMTNIQQTSSTVISSHEKDIKELLSEMRTLRSQVTIKTRISPTSMTPFASRSGGNESPR